MKLRTKYQRPGTSSFRQEAFKVFPYMCLCKTSDTRAGVIFFIPGLSFDNLNRGLLDTVIYQISKACAY